LANAENAAGLLASAANAPGLDASLEKAGEFCAIALSAEVCAAESCEFADSADACWTSEWNADGSLASAAKALGFDVKAEKAAGLDTNAEKPGSLASCRKFGSLTMIWNASVCINSGTAVSPSVTSPSPTWDETYRCAGPTVP